MDITFPHPDWNILGYTRSDGTCVMIASSDIQKALVEVRDSLGYELRHGYLSAVPTGRTFTLECVMGSLVVAYGATYAEAFTKLMGAWNPDEGRSTQELVTPKEIGK